MTKDAPPPVGPYSQAIQAGEFLFVAGQIPADPVTGDIVRDDIQKATKRVMENLKAIVVEAGYSMEDLVRCRVYLKSMDDFKQMNEVYGSYFGEKPPARAAIEVSKLPLDVDVEISALAWKK